MAKKRDELDQLRSWFGVHQSSPKFDASVSALLATGLPMQTVREIIGGIWSEAYVQGLADAWE